MSSMSHKLLKYRWFIVIFALVLAIVSLLELLQIESEPDLRSYFPASMSAMVETDRIEAVFGNQDLLMLVLESDDVLQADCLERLQRIEQGLADIPGIVRTNSLFASDRIYGEDGIMYVEPTVGSIPESPEERAQLRQTIMGNDLVYKVFVSDDFRATNILITLDSDVDEKQLFGAIEEVLEANPGKETLHFGGLPWLRQAVGKDIRRDGLFLIPSALVLMFIFLLIAFREWRGAWLPFAMVVLSSLAGLALLALLGWKFYLITLLVPIMLIAVANDYGIHLIAKYQELSREDPGLSMPELSVKIAARLWKPVLLTGLTTIAGLSSLSVHSMIPARQMALVAGIGILFAVVYSLVLLPAVLSMLSAPKKQQARKALPGAERLLEGFSRFVVRRAGAIPLATLIICLLTGLGISRLQVDANEENFFPADHQVKRAAKLINEKFGGAQSISLMFSGDMLDPAILKRMDRYCSQIETLEGVDHAMAFSGVVREISKALHDPDEELYDKIPPTREAVAQYMELYAMNGDWSTLEQLVDLNYSQAHMIVRVNNGSKETAKAVLASLRSMTHDDPNLSSIGGNVLIRLELSDLVVRGTFISLGVALFIIFILVSVIFRAPMAGVLTLIPLLMSNIMLFGIMGLFGIRLDVATALLAGIMIGIGIDYSIHFLWRYREERRINSSPEEAIMRSIQTSGRGIIINALSVMVGFVVLLLSAFSPIRFFGVLVLISVSCCLLGAILILPALILRHRYRFLEAEQGQKAPRSTAVRLPKRVAVLLLLLGSILTLQGQSARELVMKSREKMQVPAFEAISTLRIEDARGNVRLRKNAMASLSMKDGTEKRVIRFIEPAEVRGTAILVFDYKEKADDMWIYLPALRKTRRIISRELSKSFMGSEFSNADMLAPSPDDFSYEIVGSENLDGHECYKLKAVPVSEALIAQYGYSSSLSWIGKKDYLVRRSNYYNKRGQLYKTIERLDFKMLDAKNKRYMVMHMQARNHLNHRSSEMIVEEAVCSLPDANYFSVEYIESQ